MQRLKRNIALLNVPLLVLYLITLRDEFVQGDIRRWSNVQHSEGASFWRFLLLCRSKVFRSILYHRMKGCSFVVQAITQMFALVYWPERTLVIYTRQIGPGLFIQHGLCTIVAAKSIGQNCWINQQVTLGYTNDTDCPVIGDNVSIGCGAKVLGDVVVGDNVKIGANAVVVKNVPPNCKVVGVPARIVGHRI